MLVFRLVLNPVFPTLIVIFSILKSEIIEVMGHLVERTSFGSVLLTPLILFFWICFKPSHNTFLSFV